MSHVAVLLTSETCGHCRNMRGNGRLLSKSEIKKEGKQPTIPGGNHFDAAYMKKLITTEIDAKPKLRVINLHYKSFNPTEGMMDISIFTLEADGNVKQTMLKESNGKTNMAVYLVGESGKVISSQNIDTSWADINKSYVPVNISAYAFFFPSLILFEGNEWTNGLKNNQPVYGYLNGFETKTEAPYGGKAGGQPNVMDFSKFLAQFFNGTKELRGKPAAEVAVKKETVEKEEIVLPIAPTKKDEIVLPVSGNKRKFRLYVVEK